MAAHDRVAPRRVNVRRFTASSPLWLVMAAVNYTWPLFEPDLPDEIGAAAADAEAQLSAGGAAAHALASLSGLLEQGGALLRGVSARHRVAIGCSSSL